MSRPAGYSEFYALLRMMPGMDKDELKCLIVSEYTDGRTESLHEMTMQEYLAAVEGMKRKVPAVSKNVDVNRLIRQKRSAVLHKMQQIGVDTARWKAVNEFCSNKRIAGKVFRELGANELDALLIKLRAIEKKDKVKSKV